MRLQKRLAGVGYGIPLLVLLLIILPANAAVGEHHTTTGLILDTHMNEGIDNTCSDGTDVCDSSGEDTNGTFTATSPTWSIINASFFGNATDYAGSDDRTNFGASIVQTGDKTVCALLELSGGGGALQTVMTNGDPTISGNLPGFMFLLDGSDFVSIAIGNGGAANHYLDCATTEALVDGTPEWVCFTQNSTGLFVYQNNTLECSDTSTDDSEVVGNVNLRFADEYDAGNFDYNGEMDEIRIWNRSLTLAEMIAETNTNSSAVANEAPNVTIVEPVDNSLNVGASSLDSVNLNFSVTDDTNATVNCNYTLDTDTPVSIGQVATSGFNFTDLPTWTFGNHNVTVSCSDGNLTGNDTVSMDIFFIQWNVSIFNEKTEALFDMTQPNTTTMEVFCPTQTQILNITSNTLLFNTTCTYDFVRLTMIFGNDQYFRTLIPPVANVTLNWYMVDLNINTIVELTLTIDDFTGDFSGSETLVRITKILTTGQVDIIEQFVDIENKVILFLIQSDVYNVQVENAAADVRVFGSLIIDSDTDKTLRISDIPLESDVITIYDTVNYTVGTPTNSSIRLVYNDSGETSFSNVTFTIFNESNLSQILFNETVLNANDLTITWAGANVNQSYEWKIEITHSVFGSVTQYGTVSFLILQRIPLDIGSQWRTIFAVLIVLMVAASMTQVYSGMAVIATVGTISILKFFGWLPMVTLSALAFLWIIAIISMLIKGESKL